MKAAIYARKSTDDQNAASVTRQVEHGRLFAEKKGWSVSDQHIFSDDGYSGADFRERPGLLRLLNATSSKPRPFDVVVMAEASRLGRDRLRTELVARDLHEAGVALWYYGTGEQERLDTVEGRFVLAARSFAAELERAKAKERTRDAHAAHARRGHVTGGVVYGYRNVPVYTGTDSSGTPVRSHVLREIEPDEADVVRGIFRAFADGLGRRAIAHALNGDPSYSDVSARYFGGRRISPPRSGSWGPGTLRAMLERPLYRGSVEWGRYRNVDRDGRTRRREREPDGPQIVIQEDRLRIVEPALWEAVERRRARTGPRGGGVPKKQAASLLSGMASCGRCNGPVIIVGSRRRIRTYGCGWRINRGATVCTNRLLASAPAIDREFVETLGDHLFTEPARREIFDQARRMLAAASVTGNQDQIRMREELRRCEATAAALVSLVEQEALAGTTPTSLLARLRALEEEKRNLELRLREVSALTSLTELELRRSEQELAHRLQDLRGELLGDLSGARSVLSRLLVGRVNFIPERDDRAYRVRAILAPARAVSGMSPTGFEPVLPT